MIKQQNFTLKTQWTKRVEIQSDILQTTPELIFIFETLLKKRPEIIQVSVNRQSGVAIIDFNADKLSKDSLFNIVDVILGNLKSKSLQKTNTEPDWGSDDAIKEISLKVDGMSCPACAALIKVSLKKHRNIFDVNADFETKDVVIYGTLGKEELVQMIEELGYKHINEN